MKNIAIVTGASSGIGKEFFLSLPQRADKIDEVWVVARNEQALINLQEEVNLPIKVFAVDLSKKSAVTPIKEALKQEEYTVKYCILASGFGKFSAVDEEDSEVLENMVDLNCRSILSMTKAVMPYLNETSTILLIASLASFQPIPYIATYGATKAFVLSYGRALNRELKKSKKGRCMCVCPFWTKTAFFKRAETENKVVKKYAVMYLPQQIVDKAWKDLAHKKRDISVYGAYAKAQMLFVKLLPHQWVMNVWLAQQKLK